MIKLVFWNIKSDKVEGSVENANSDQQSDTGGEESEDTSDKRDIPEPRRSAILGVLERLVRQENVDVLLLAECPTGFAKPLLDYLLRAGFEFENRTVLFPSKKVRAFVRRSIVRLQPIESTKFPEKDPPDFDEDLYDHNRLTQLHLTDPDGKTLLLLCAVHLVDKSRHNQTTQREEARRIARRIRYTEKTL